MSEILTPETIELKASLGSQEEAIRRAGALLVANGNVEDRYIDSMLEREQSVSTYMGNSVAIPHGTLAGKDLVIADGLCYLQFPEGVDWHGDEVTVCIGIAAGGDGHVPILAQLAELLMDPDRAEALRNLSRLILRDLDSLGTLESQQTGKPISQGRRDTELCARYFDFYASAIETFSTAWTRQETFPNRPE